MRSKIAWELAVAALFTLALLVPFVSKPFNVDDPFYLKMAGQISADPLRPYSFSINWSGQTRDVWEHSEATFPPLVPYYIALVAGLFGSSPAVLHLFFLIFPLAAAFSLYFILKKYTTNPLPWTLTAVAAPAFIVPATGIMLDLPLSALMLSSTALFMRGVDRDRAALVGAGAVLAGLALLAKYTGMLLVPLFLTYLFLEKKLKYAWWLAVPAAFFGLWCLHNELVYGGMHFFRSASRVGKGISAHKLIAVPLFFSGALAFPAASLLSARGREITVAAVAAAAVFALAFAVSRAAVASVFIAVFFVSSCFFLYKAASTGFEGKTFITAWFALSGALVLMVEPWVSGRYMLVVLPPALVFAAKVIKYEKITLVLTLFAGLAAATADLRWARVYPEAARYISAKYGAGHDVYFTGHFGFQYYMEQAGMKALETDNPPSGPAVLAACALADPQRPGPDLVKRLSFMEYSKAADRFPVRVAGPKCGAGFYSSLWGILPYSLSAEPLEEFAVFRIERK